MLIAVTFTIAKIWKQPKCPTIDDWIKKSCGTFLQLIQLGHKNEGNLPICVRMGGPGEYYAK